MHSCWNNLFSHKAACAARRHGLARSKTRRWCPRRVVQFGPQRRSRARALQRMCFHRPAPQWRRFAGILESAKGRWRQWQHHPRFWPGGGGGPKYPCRPGVSCHPGSNDRLYGNCASYLRLLSWRGAPARLLSGWEGDRGGGAAWAASGEQALSRPDRRWRHRPGPVHGLSAAQRSSGRWNSGDLRARAPGLCPRHPPAPQYSRQRVS